MTWLPPASVPGPLPPGTTWVAQRAYGERTGLWSVFLPGSWGHASVHPVTVTGPRGGTRRAWVARASSGRNLHITDPHPTREIAARHAFHAAGLVPGVEVLPCPDCGQGWPDGCAFECPSRDE